jgi:hypothetical protein
MANGSPSAKLMRDILRLRGGVAALVAASVIIIRTVTSSASSGRVAGICVRAAQPIRRVPQVLAAPGVARRSRRKAMARSAVHDSLPWSPAWPARRPEGAHACWSGSTVSAPRAARQVRGARLAAVESGLASTAA